MPLFSNADLLFLLARAYEDWSRTLAERRGSAEKKAEAEKHAATARATFEKLYTANLQVGAFKRRAGGAPADANAWLHDAATWRALADKCAFAGSGFVCRRSLRGRGSEGRGWSRSSPLVPISES